MKYLNDNEINKIMSFIESIDSIGEAVAEKLSDEQNVKFKYRRYSYIMEFPTKYDSIFTYAKQIVSMWNGIKIGEFELRLLFKNDDVELNLKGHFSKEWNRMIESFVVKLSDGTILETTKLWELRMMLNGTYKKTTFHTKYEKLCSTAHIKFIILPYAETIELLKYKGELQPKSYRWGQYLIDISYNINELVRRRSNKDTSKLWCCIILCENNQVTFTMGDFDNKPTYDEFTELLVTKINRFCYSSEFDLFENDTKNKQKIDFGTYQLEHQHYHKNVCKILAYSLKVNDNRFTNEYHDNVLKKTINNIIN